jgi:uncharacterized surface protein with fasciclin (FAS1) repeats
MFLSQHACEFSSCFFHNGKNRVKSARNRLCAIWHRTCGASSPLAKKLAGGKKMKKVKTGLLALALSLGLAGAAMAESVPDKDIVEIAASAGSFKTLVAAVQAGGLVDVLKSEGPFTVFAPTDEAFGKLPAGTVEYLLKPENKSKLVAILTYHVVAGRVTAGEVVSLSSAKTVNGQELRISAKDGSVMVDDAHVTGTDIMASNGIIHVIDSVILPR